MIPLIVLAKQTKNLTRAFMVNNLEKQDSGMIIYTTEDGQTKDECPLRPLRDQLPASGSLFWSWGAFKPSHCGKVSAKLTKGAR